MNTTSCLCAAALLAAGGAVFALPASAANATQQACSSQYQAAKSAGTLNGQKWPDFYSSCAASMKSGSTAAVAPAPAATPPATQTAAAPKGKSWLGGLIGAATGAGAAAGASTGASPAANTAVKTAVAHGGQTTQQLCSAQYQSAKSAGTLNGQTWPAFYSACAASIRNYQEPATAPAMPTVAAAPAGKAPGAQANYQPPAGMSSGEAAFQQRIHACAAEWRNEKTAGTLPSGSQWPQFWSACNTQLKQQG